MEEEVEEEMDMIIDSEGNGNGGGKCERGSPCGIKKKRVETLKR